MMEKWVCSARGAMKFFANPKKACRLARTTSLYLKGKKVSPFLQTLYIGGGAILVTLILVTGVKRRLIRKGYYSGVKKITSYPRGPGDTHHLCALEPICPPEKQPFLGNFGDSPVFGLLRASPHLIPAFFWPI